MQLNGKANLTGWRWIFLIEGIFTCLLGVAGYWILVDFPDSDRETWRFLGKQEKAWVVSRVQSDRGDANVPPFKWRKFLGAGTDWKIWAYAMIFFNTTTVTYALAYFLPIILTGNMGFDVGTSQCLVAPPYALAGIVMISTAWAGDRYKVRGPIILFNMVLCITGLPIMGFHPNPNVRYFGVFLTTAGANSNVPAVMSYQANNIRGQWKRALASATLVGFGGIGGVAGGMVFRERDAPAYRPGLIACLSCSGLTIILVGLLTINSYYQNQKADRGEKELEMNDVSFIITIQTIKPRSIVSENSNLMCRKIHPQAFGLPTRMISDFTMHLYLCLKHYPCSGGPFKHS
jgi:sugar phosphate permease